MASELCVGEVVMLGMFCPVDPIGVKDIENKKGLLSDPQERLTIKSMRVHDKKDQTFALTFERHPGFEYESCFFKLAPPLAGPQAASS